MKTKGRADCQRTVELFSRRPRMRRAMASTALAVLAFLVVGPTRNVKAWADWPQFRGTMGSGHADARNLPTSWNLLRNIDWQTPLPGVGWSSPVIIGDKIWVTLAEATVLPPEERAALLERFADDTESFNAFQRVALFALEVNLDDGRVLRKIRLGERNGPLPLHAANNFASSTPCSDGQRLFCHFGTSGTWAVDLASGQIVWERRLEYDTITHVGSSPIVVGGTLLFACDGAESQFVVGLDKDRGGIQWKTTRPPITSVHAKHRRSFSTPLAVDHAGQLQVIVPCSQWIVAYEPRTGRELWRVNHGEGRAVVPCPAAERGLVFCCTGYPKPQLWAVRLGGEGDVSESHVAWIYDRQAPELSSPLVVDGLIYLVSIVGVANCLDAATGERLWTRRFGGRFGASPVHADGKIYFTNEEGTTTVVRPARTYQEVAKSQAAGIHLASPAVAAESLIFRSSEGLYRVKSARP